LVSFEVVFTALREAIQTGILLFARGYQQLSILQENRIKSHLISTFRINRFEFSRSCPRNSQLHCALSFADLFQRNAGNDENLRHSMAFMGKPLWRKGWPKGLFNFLMHINVA